MPSFTFKIDNSITVTTDSNGFARVNNLSIGNHTVSEIVPDGWTLSSVSPSSGVVMVTPSLSQCVKITFKNTKKEDKPSCVITATPDHIVIYEDPELKWTSKNAVSATLNQGIGSVPVNGTYNVFPEETTTYTLTVTSASGKTAQCSVTVTVTVVPPDDDSETSCDIWVSDDEVEPGDTVTLFWDSIGNDPWIENVGDVPNKGSRAEQIDSDTTFTLHVYSDFGVEEECSVTVTVDDGTGDPEEPSCDIWANDTSIKDYESTTLYWTSANADTATLNQGIGSVNVNGSRIVSPDNTTTYTLTVQNESGTDQCSVTIEVDEDIPVDEPSCDIWASDTSIRDTESTTLTWVSDNADSASINQGIGSVNVNGSRIVSPDHTTTYTLTVQGDGGSEQCRVTITVSETPVEDEDPSCDIWASDTHITDGESTTLTWNSDNAVSASLSSVGSVNENGSRVVWPNMTKTYTLTVWNDSGESAQCRVTITVEEDDDNDEDPSCWIDANPGSVEYGEGTNLTWDSDNASSASISSIGSVSTSGNRWVGALYNDKTYTLTVRNDSGETAQCSTTVEVDEEDDSDNDEPSCWIHANPSSIDSDENAYLTWNSSDASSASLSSVGSVGTSGSYSVSPDYTRTYTLTVYGSNGESAQCHTIVHVDEDDSDDDDNERPSCDIYQAQQSGNWWNSGVYLSWNSDYADRATLSGYGNVPTDGSKTVYPTRDTTYTLTVWNDDGDTEQCSTRVYVDDNDHDDDDDHERPSCSIQLSNYYEGPHGKARLSWWSENARHASISPSIGSVNTSDSMTVNTDGHRQYTMTVTGPGGSATCHTSYITPYLPPIIGTPYVSLTQIPYTGFDFGLFGNALYWVGMILLALGGAHLIARQRGGVLAFAQYQVPVAPSSVKAQFETALKVQYQAFANVASLAASPVRALWRRG